MVDVSLITPSIPSTLRVFWCFEYSVLYLEVFRGSSLAGTAGRYCMCWEHFVCWYCSCWVRVLAVLAVPSDAILRQYCGNTAATCSTRSSTEPRKYFEHIQRVFTVTNPEILRARKCPQCGNLEYCDYILADSAVRQPEIRRVHEVPALRFLENT